MDADRSKGPSFIAPERLYALKSFVIASGISSTRMREARRLGVLLTTIKVGRRIYVRGVDAIDYIERLAKLNKSEQLNSEGWIADCETPC